MISYMAKPMGEFEFFPGSSNDRALIDVSINNQVVRTTTVYSDSRGGAYVNIDIDRNVSDNTTNMPDISDGEIDWILVTEKYMIDRKAWKKEEKVKRKEALEKEYDDCALIKFLPKLQELYPDAKLNMTKKEFVVKYLEGSYNTGNGYGLEVRSETTNKFSIQAGYSKFALSCGGAYTRSIYMEVIIKKIPKLLKAEKIKLAELAEKEKKKKESCDKLKQLLGCPVTTDMWSESYFNAEIKHNVNLSIQVNADGYYISNSNGFYCSEKFLKNFGKLLKSEVV